MRQSLDNLGLGREAAVSDLGSGRSVGRSLILRQVKLASMGKVCRR